MGITIEQIIESLKQLHGDVTYWKECQPFKVPAGFEEKVVELFKMLDEDHAELNKADEEINALVSDQSTREEKTFTTGEFFKFAVDNRKERLEKYEHAKNEPECQMVKLAGWAKPISDVALKVQIETEERAFSDGLGTSMKTLKVEVDLSKTKWAWQPHDDQEADFAQGISEMILSTYHDYASNMD